MTALKLVATDCDCEACAGPNIADMAVAIETIADLQRQVDEFSVERTKLNYMIIDSRKEDAGWLQKFREACDNVKYWRDKHDDLLERHSRLLRQQAPTPARKTKPRKKPAKPKRKV